MDAVWQIALVLVGTGIIGIAVHKLAKYLKDFAAKTDNKIDDAIVNLLDEERLKQVEDYLEKQIKDKIEKELNKKKEEDK